MLKIFDNYYLDASSVCYVLKKAHVKGDGKVEYDVCTYHTRLEEALAEAVRCGLREGVAGPGAAGVYQPCRRCFGPGSEERKQLCINRRDYMLELYFNDGNFLPESREEEQSAETVLNIMLAGKTADTEMCIWPCFYHAPMCKGVLINLDDGTTLRIKPFLNKEGEPELLITCVTEETVEEVYQRGSNYDFDEPCAGNMPS